MRGAGGLARAAIGIAVSVVAIALVLRSVDLAAALDALRRANVAWVALLVGLITVDVVLRAARWRLLLRPVAQVPFRATLQALLVGYLANNVLPARLGELVRSHVLGDRTGISRSTVLGTVVVERIVDTAVVVAIAAAAILVLSVRGIVASGVLVGLALTGLLVVVVAAGILAHRLPGADRVTALLDRWPQVRASLGRLREGLAVAGRPRTLASTVVISLGSWSCAVLGFAAAGQAVGLEPTIGQAALLAAGVNLATAVPSAPGYVGTFELAAIAIAASVGIPEAPALAMALLLHAVSLVLISISGAAVVARMGLVSLRPPAGSAPQPR
ncbi:MAG TPA: lysylphosphatidylglycerol synthase transmembrane domain-containing protein [Candidatus Limnocylindrales bacterium]|nr:lysylphosphatidylglycerol synthase transmembrane domain-containing protein [Candidatus Limnocylindrales bacterium]